MVYDLFLQRLQLEPAIFDPFFIPRELHSFAVDNVNDEEGDNYDLADESDLEEYDRAKEKERIAASLFGYKLTSS